MRPRRAWASLLGLALITTSCGSMLTRAQLEAADGRGQVMAGSGQVAAGDQSATTGQGTAMIASGGSAGTPGTPGRASTGYGRTATAAGSPAAAASGAPAPSAPGAPNPYVMPAGGNGGATDVGVTSSSITVGDVATLTGPVPGLFNGAVYGAQAFFAYINSLGGIYGRQLKLKVGDDQLNENQNRAETTSLIPQVLSFVGSFSVFDGGMTQPLQGTNVPDIGVALDQTRNALPNNFSVQPEDGGWQLGALEYFKAHYPPDVWQHVGAIVGDVPSALAAWQGEKAAMLSQGYQISYEATYEPTQTDFSADVYAMKQNHVEMVVMAADVTAMARVAQTMQQQNFTVPLPDFGANAYDPSFFSLAGNSAAEGTLVYQSASMFDGEDAGSVPEVALFDTWYGRTHPGSKPDLFAAYSWASARLFVQALISAGPKATRTGLMNALKQIDNFDSNGLLAPAGPASKRAATCYIFIKAHNGQWSRFDDPPTGYRCDGSYYKP